MSLTQLFNFVQSDIHVNRNGRLSKEQLASLNRSFQRDILIDTGTLLFWLAIFGLFLVSVLPFPLSTEQDADHLLVTLVAGSPFLIFIAYLFIIRNPAFDAVRFFMLNLKPTAISVHASVNDFKKFRVEEAKFSLHSLFLSPKQVYYKIRSTVYVDRWYAHSVDNQPKEWTISNAEWYKHSSYCLWLSDYQYNSLRADIIYDFYCYVDMFGIYYIVGVG